MMNNSDSHFSVPAVASLWVSLAGVSLALIFVPTIMPSDSAWEITLPGAAAVVLGVIGIIDYRRRPLRRKDLFCAVTGLVLGVLLTWLCAAVLLSQPGPSHRTACSNNLHQIGIMTHLYAKEHGGEFPPVEGWNSAVMKYTEHEAILYCPEESDKSMPSYAMNRRLLGLTIGDVVDPVNTVLIYESVPGRNLFGGPALFPSPARHGDEDPNYLVLFCDGHVKAVDEKGIDRLNWDPKKKGKLPYQTSRERR